MTYQNKQVTFNLSNPQQSNQVRVGPKTNVTVNGKPVYMPAQIPMQPPMQMTGYKTPGSCNFNTGARVCEDCPELKCDYKYKCIKHEPVDCSCSTGGSGVGDCNCFQPRDLKWWIGSL